MYKFKQQLVSHRKTKEVVCQKCGNTLRIAANANLSDYCCTRIADNKYGFRCLGKLQEL